MYSRVARRKTGLYTTLAFMDCYEHVCSSVAWVNDFQLVDIKKHIKVRESVRFLYQFNAECDLQVLLLFGGIKTPIFNTSLTLIPAVRKTGNL